MLSTSSLILADDFENALAIWAGQIDKAMAILRLTGSSGSLRAQLFLGRVLQSPPRMRDNARMFKPDVQEALKWFRIASEQGSGEASAAIADLCDGATVSLQIRVMRTSGTIMRRNKVGTNKKSGSAPSSGIDQLTDPFNAKKVR